MTGITTLPVFERKIVDPLSGGDWDSVAQSHPDCTIFHTTAWARVLFQTYGHRSLYLQITRANTLFALLPMMEVSSPFTGRRGICLPFSDFCNALIFDIGDIGPIVELLSKLAAERSWKHFELRCGGSSPQPLAPALTTYRGYQVDLRGGAEMVFSRFASSARRAIRKAENSHLDCQVVSTREAILKYYRLHVRTRRRHGLPSQPVSFFLRIYENIIKPGLGFVVLVENKSRPVAAAIFFSSGKKGVYKFGASDETYQNLRANNLVMWVGIKSLVERGAETLHLGRTSMQNEGLRRFKLSWGAKEEAIRYFRFDVPKLAWVNSRHFTGAAMCTRVFSRLPLLLNRGAGAMIYPHSD